MTNDEFLTAKKETLLHGAKYCLANANAHFECAQESGKIRHYGIANSLLILSVEECIKCAALLSGYLNVKIPFAIEPIFYKHRDKHKQAAEVQPLMEEIFLIKSIVQTILEKRKLTFSFILDLALLVIFLKNYEKKKEKIALWWKEANNLKNKGFYVDFKNNNWVSPDCFNEENYIESLGIAKTFVEVLEFVKDLRDEDYKSLSR